MIALDTNVVSELIRAKPEPRVVAWVDGLVVADVCTTAITAAELLHGIALLPAGRRRARRADIAARRSGLGRPISQADAQIAPSAGATERRSRPGTSRTSMRRG